MVGSTSKRLILLAVVVLALHATVGCGRRDCQRVVWSEVSPDQRFEIVLCSLPARGVAMPGQGGDVPGLVRLHERATGKILHETELEMVQMMTDVTWSADHVSIMLIAEWDLPPPTKPRGGGASK